MRRASVLDIVSLKNSRRNLVKNKNREDISGPLFGSNRSFFKWFHILGVLLYI
jgi:hypothetical protein